MQDLLIEIGKWPSIPLCRPLFIRLLPWMTSIPSKQGCASLGSGPAAHTAAIYDHCRKQLLRFGTQILTKTINKVDFSFSTTPFMVLEPRHIGLCYVRPCCTHFQEQALRLLNWRWGFSSHGGGHIPHQVWVHCVHHP